MNSSEKGGVLLQNFDSLQFFQKCSKPTVFFLLEPEPAKKPELMKKDHLHNTGCNSLCTVGHRS